MSESSQAVSVRNHKIPEPAKIILRLLRNHFYVSGKIIDHLPRAVMMPDFCPEYRTTGFCSKDADVYEYSRLSGC